MRMVTAVSLALALLFVTAGCLLNRYSSDPAERTQQLNVIGGALTGSARPAEEAASPAAPDPLELRKSLAEKKARLHETQAQFYKLEAQRYAVQKALRGLEAQIAADEKGLGEALKKKPTLSQVRPKRDDASKTDRGAPPEKSRPMPPQGAATPSLSSRLWGAVDRLQSSLGVHVINVYSSDPNRRIVELLNNSEDLRQIEYEWERIWFTDHPAHLTPERVDGGVQR